MIGKIYKIIIKPIKDIIHSKRLKRRFNSIVLRDNTIISSNCVAGLLYHDIGLKFNSPIIDLTFSPNDFIVFCENISNLNNSSICQIKTDKKYPVGKLLFNETGQEVTIYFVHYSNFGDAKAKFYERCERIQKETRIIFMVKELTDDMIISFEKFEYKKICIYGKYDGNRALNNGYFRNYKPLFLSSKDVFSYKNVFSTKKIIDDIWDFLIKFSFL